MNATTNNNATQIADSRSIRFVFRFYKSSRCNWLWKVRYFVQRFGLFAVECQRLSGLTALTYWIDSSAVLGFGPGGAVEVFGGEFGGVDDDVADLLPLPSVGNMNQAIVGLDDRGIGIFAGL